ncbi:hypothetical protein MKEN_00804600 [Mycena kentingensis (nom. inval.)]|nr:hypothetical protein MKEN_00804600 [Mycena kentingensis (nom. inval.)]
MSDELPIVRQTHPSHRSPLRFQSAQTENTKQLESQASRAALTVRVSEPAESQPVHAQRIPRLVALVSFIAWLLSIVWRDPRFRALPNPQYLTAIAHPDADLCSESDSEPETESPEQRWKRILIERRRREQQSGAILAFAGAPEDLSSKEAVALDDNIGPTYLAIPCTTSFCQMPHCRCSHCSKIESRTLTSDSGSDRDDPFSVLTDEEEESEVSSTLSAEDDADV